MRKTLLIPLSLFLGLSTPLVGAADYQDQTAILRALAPIDGQQVASLNLSIAFRFGKATLSKDAHQQLDALAAALKSAQLSEARVGIYGHTDAVGKATANQKLSEERAKSVVAYLVEKHGIDAARLEAMGFGESKLLNAANPSAAENRRVEIANLSLRGDGKKDGVDKSGIRADVHPSAPSKDEPAKPAGIRASLEPEPTTPEPEPKAAEPGPAEPAPVAAPDQDSATDAAGRIRW